MHTSSLGTRVHHKSDSVTKISSSGISFETLCNAKGTQQLPCSSGAEAAESASCRHQYVPRCATDASYCLSSRPSAHGARFTTNSRQIRGNEAQIQAAVTAKENFQIAVGRALVYRVDASCRGDSGPASKARLPSLVS
jgi:hypothetical protein